MLDGQMVTVTCNGMEIPWSFESAKMGTLPREDICVTINGDADPGFVIKETIGSSIINTRGIERMARHNYRLSEDGADRRRDDNLRDMFGGC